MHGHEARALELVLALQFLCNGLEEDFALKRHTAGNAGTELDLLVQSSGKMLLLHKLLPKLRSEGHKVGLASDCLCLLLPVSSPNSMLPSVH